MDELKKYLNDIEQLCSRHKVNKLYAFGSILTDHFNKSSDVDFIVDFQPLDLLQYADNYYELKFSLETILHRPVDLLEEQTINNPYFQQVVNSKRQLVYEY
ncbi:MAG TPA: nucleotidyltransferase domain-containing protein [Puia sp.]|nr:nucleotidyltransferase domain-containing protein [Puia sp.]